jgi:hypothetical protein
MPVSFHCKLTSQQRRFSEDENWFWWYVFNQRSGSRAHIVCKASWSEAHHVDGNPRVNFLNVPGRADSLHWAKKKLPNMEGDDRNSGVYHLAVERSLQTFLSMQHSKEANISLEAAQKKIDAVALDPVKSKELYEGTRLVLMFDETHMQAKLATIADKFVGDATNPEVADHVNKPELQQQYDIVYPLSLRVLFKKHCSVSGGVQELMILSPRPSTTLCRLFAPPH